MIEMKPRTVCGSHFIFFWISAAVAPLGLATISKTWAALLPGRGPSALAGAPLAFLAALAGALAFALAFAPFWLLGAPLADLALFLAVAALGASGAPGVATGAALVR